MRTTARFADPTDSEVEITLRGSLGEFEKLRKYLGDSNVPFYAVQALLSQLGDVSRRLRGKVEAEEQPAIGDGNAKRQDPKGLGPEDDSPGAEGNRTNSSPHSKEHP